MVLQAITNAASKVHTLTISAETVTRGIILSKYILRHKLALLADPAPNQPCVSKAVLTKDDLMINKEKISKVLSQNTITSRSIVTNHRNIKGAANNYESANSLIQSLSECGFGDLVVKDGSSAVMLKRRSLNDMNSDTRKFLSEFDVDVSLYENLVNADNVSSTPKPKKQKTVK